MNDQQKECTICDNKYTQVLRKKVTCESCKYTFCRKCLYNYIQNLKKDIDCPSCHVILKYAFILENSTYGFIHHIYSQNRKDILFDRAKRDLQRVLPAATIIYNNRCAIVGKNIVKEPRLILDIYLMHCPRDSCVGWISKETKVCNTCQCRMCEDCEKITNLIGGYTQYSTPTLRGERHKCNQEDVTNLTILRKISKRCPTCLTLIIKTEGCLDIWCSVCHTFFDFATGNRTSPKHNPDHQDYIKQQLNDIPDIVFGWTNILYYIQPSSSLLIRNLYETYKDLSKKINLELHSNKVTSDKIKIDYILRDIDEDTLKNRLFDQENRFERFKIYRSIVIKYLKSIENIFHQLEYFCPKDAIGSKDHLVKFLMFKSDAYKTEINKELKYWSNLLKCKFNDI